jgi:hypothetical protein
MAIENNFLEYFFFFRFLVLMNTNNQQISRVSTPSHAPATSQNMHQNQHPSTIDRNDIAYKQKVRDIYQRKVYV